MAGTSAGELLRIGARGPAVAEVQRMLGIAADGVFGRQTRRRGARVPGRARARGRRCRRARHARGARRRRRRAARSTQRLPAATTIAVQRALGISADGVFGRQTRSAVRAFQSSHGLEVDGVVGPQTLGALGIQGAAAPVGGGGGSAVARGAARRSGRPYALGGVGPNSWDCSGPDPVGVRPGRRHAAAHELRAGERGRARRPRGGPGRRPRVLRRQRAGRVARRHRHQQRRRRSPPPATACASTRPTGSYWGKHYYGARRVG